MRALAIPLGIGCQRRLIDKKLPNPSRKQRRRTERSGLGFFSGNPEPALPLQRWIKQFDYYELPSGQVSRSFLVGLKNFIDLVCSCSRSSRSHRLDIYLERGNSLVGSVYTTNRANLVSSMHTAGKVVSCTAERVTSSITAIFVCRVNN